MGIRFGQNVIFYMNQGTLVSSAWLPTMASSLVLVGVVDVNGDGFVDMIWRNTANGVNAVWYMQRDTIIGTGILPTLVGTDWVIVH